MRHSRLLIISILVAILLSACTQGVKKHPNLYPAFEIIDNEKVWGFINSKGKFVIEPLFDEVSDFSKEGLAKFKFDNAYGVINSEGKIIVPAEFQFISDFTEDFIFAFDGKSNHVYNLKGERQFFTDEFLYIGKYNDNLFPAAKLDDEGNPKFGYLSNKGEVMIEPIYEETWTFRNGKGLVKIDENKYELIDTDGNTIIELPYYLVLQIDGSDLFFFVKEKEGKIGVLDKDGNVLLEPTFTRVSDLSGDYIIFVENIDDTERFGISDFSGNVVLEPEYSVIKPLGKGYFAVGNDDNKFALTNEKGEFITEYIYDDLGSDEDILADKIPAFDGQKTYLISLNGVQSDTIPEITGKANVVYDGKVSKVNANGRITYYNNKGDIIWEEKNYFVLNEDAKVTENSFVNNEGLSIKYPVVEGLKNKDVEDSINSKLYELFVDDKIEEAKLNNYSYYSIVYTVNKFNDMLIIDSMSEYMYESDLYPIKEGKIYNISLSKGTFFEFEDLFVEGSPYIEVISDIVKGMMEQQMMQGMGFYDIANWEGIKPDQNFIARTNTIDIFVNPEELNVFSDKMFKFTVKHETIAELLDMKADFWWTFMVSRGF